MILTAATSRTDHLDAILSEVTDFFAEDPSRARLIWREAIDRPRHTRDAMSQDFGPWLMLLTDGIRRGQEAGHIRSDVDPEAWITQLCWSLAPLLLQVGCFRLPGIVRRRVSRQVAELIRTARHSLYSSSPTEEAP